ncbi:hypothetical protein PSPO01_15605 [Paraphaeosphaeria sporulosa]
MTNMTYAHSYGRRLSHSALTIPSRSHYSRISNCNATNGTTIIVTPLDTDAGNMNNMLLPTPMPMMATTGLLYCIITWMAGFYTLRNVAYSPNNVFSSLSTSTNHINFQW